MFTGCGGGEESSSPPSRSSSVSEPEPESLPASEPEPEPESLPDSESQSAPEEAPDAVTEAAPTASESAEPEMRELTLTIPEGYTLARVGMVLEEEGVCTAEEFIAAAQADTFGGFPLVAQQAYDENRCFRLEGYLFPDTYHIYSTESPDAIIRRILEHTHQKLDANLLARIEKSGYTVDEILTLASIIEKEAFGHNQMPYISSVLHNRLDAGMQLQCDVTITYVEGAIKPFISGDINRYNEHYNTYKCPALPAGAICNPGLSAIQAAVSPADTDYLYFVTDADKNYYYASEYDDHLDNVEKAGL